MYLHTVLFPTYPILFDTFATPLDPSKGLDEPIAVVGAHHDRQPDGCGLLRRFHVLVSRLLSP